MTDPRYAILFEPVKIGPVTAKNRFYQVPHCNGSGHRYPQTMAHMRGMKAEGGWGVVCTEECEIHPSSDLSGFVEMRLWDDSDIPTHRLMTEKVHAHDALAGIQLVHTGQESGNRFSRVPALSPSDSAGAWGDPIQARAMTKSDIKTLRGWYRDAAIRAKQAEYDIVYVYAGHNGPILSHFLQPRYNQRTDEYGGSLENRVRLLREVLEETKDAIGDQCAVALRFAVHDFDDEHLQFDREGREVVEMLAELPDLWDVNISDWTHDSRTSRFGESSHQEPYIDFVKSVTTKPVVGVGRFTSPDTMVSQIKRGVIDFIGAARPSIADPFLPAKIEQDRVDEIRECIGCNICTSGDYFSVPIRCTQNPTMGEEFRKGWHPELIDKAGSNDKVMVIGGGPAGLECTLALAKRGYEVVLAERGNELGGRLLTESKLPGLNEWRRVIDHRIYMISQKPNVDCYLNSELSAEEVSDYGYERIVVATGSTWRIDGIGRSMHHAIETTSDANIVGVNDILDGKTVSGHVVIYDDDYYYMANVLAEKLVDSGCMVTYVTSGSSVASYTDATLEHARVTQRLLELGVRIICNHTVARVDRSGTTLRCIYTDKHEHIESSATLPVTTRIPTQSVYQKILPLLDDQENGIKSVHSIGDCHAPGTIAAAVYSGHLYARQLDNPVDQLYGFKRENYQASYLKDLC
ncbi:MAG: FAD-dependent oxidoreductase [Granulosicoccus sp.]|nr:FAD-dependent oxidoreductase [Granulosicoccus sp.]